VVALHPDIKCAEDLLGWDFEWLASDAEGHVGLFTTAGGGYMPERAWHHIEALDAALEAIYRLPISTTARFAPEVRSGFLNTWREAAERGLFAFDSDVDGAPYSLVASPMTPVHMSEFPAIAVGVLSHLHYRHLNFATSTTISGDSLRHD
jgi:hypothetical protein